MPVWLTLVLSVIASLVAAAGTYWLAPAINRAYQVDEVRSAHLADTTNSLNSQIIELSQQVRRLNDAIVNQTDEVGPIRQDALDSVTKLQWMLVDLRVVLTSENDRQEVQELGNSIDEVKQALDAVGREDGQRRLLAAMRSLGEDTREVLDRLYRRSSLK
ncbi:hypothetical protein [uncultured Erythrobacter sp.]|uniref:hypothetical protein n=1 Tax=uncultured Erythrobacter sp. TaxID=263913 RepID=UPI002639C169|nr:hypothetical protein [uncultured Erythrobacter sp.]